MITRLKEGSQQDPYEWHIVYFLFPRVIRIEGIAYRVYKDYVLRKRVLNEYRVWIWEYRLLNSLDKDNI